MDVGFNHPDPSIDLTSAKMLGAVSLLFFITQYPALAEDGKIFFVIGSVHWVALVSPYL